MVYKRIFAALLCLAVSALLMPANGIVLAQEIVHQYLYLPDAGQSGLDITGDLTFEAWVKFESLPVFDTSYAIISKSAGEINDAGYDLQYTLSGSGYKFVLSISPNGNVASYCRIPRVLDTGVWYHIAAVYSAANGTCELFENGERFGVEGGMYKSIANSSAPFQIGACCAAPQSFFDGLIDEVRIWSKARTQEEIRSDYQRELAGAEESLEGYWRLNESLSDQSKNGNWLLNSGAAFSSDVPFGSSTVSRLQNEVSVSLPSPAIEKAMPRLQNTPSLPPPFADELAPNQNTHSIHLENNLQNNEVYATLKTTYGG